MKDFRIEATKSTPEIDFNLKDYRLTIRGESYPENSVKFYQPVLDKVEIYSRDAEKRFIVDIELAYLNTSSVKAMMNILDLLNKAYQRGKNIEVNWYYDEDNEILYETAVEFNSFFDMNINVISHG